MQDTSPWSEEVSGWIPRTNENFGLMASQDGSLVEGDFHTVVYIHVLSSRTLQIKFKLYMEDSNYYASID